jgi:hypothetical protein
VEVLLLQLRECVIVRQRREISNEEVVADFHTYLEQLNVKCGKLETEIQRCNQRALLHKQKAEAEGSRPGKERELKRAKLHLQDKHRLQEDQDRTLRFMLRIRQQIDSLTSSQMDNIMVEAMRQYNQTAKRMGLPDKTKAIDELSKDIEKRFEEVHELQTLLSEATDPSGTGLCESLDDDDLMLELEALGSASDVLEEEPRFIIAPPAKVEQHADVVDDPQELPQAPRIAVMA